ncbi:nuclear transport factor 2 family protein [Paenibacillus sp. FSL K6-0108]|uniref:nuclear transport factor 2 family protein n=1 Tax=Paenibacillus sp. FSL K6-0108 TaxID=2921417 RepID=UPI0032558CE8
MLTALANPIQKFIEATNDHNMEALLSVFNDSSVVNDHGRDFSGLKEIKEWADTYHIGMNVTLEIKEATGTGDNYFVSTVVTGDFEGGPFPFEFHFSVNNDVIAALKIIG